MTATHYRAYAAEGDVHNPAREGAVRNGAAKFTADKEVAYVVFYDDAESPAVVARVDGPFAPGEVSVPLPASE